MRRNNQIERTKMTNFLQMFKIITNILLTGLFGTGFRIIYLYYYKLQHSHHQFKLNTRLDTGPFKSEEYS